MSKERARSRQVQTDDRQEAEADLDVMWLVSAVRVEGRGRVQSQPEESGSQPVVERGSRTNIVHVD